MTEHDTHDRDSRPAASQLGRTLDDRYRVEAEVGSGGIGAVYRATHLKLGQSVAIKILHEQYGAHPALRRRFEREATALASLAHPNIVAVTDYGVSGDTPYLVMELLEGETLAERLARGALPGSMALQLTRHLLRALSFVHERGLVHRDLKPGNVFLQRLPDGEERLKLLDFGLAKFVEAGPSAAGETVTRAGDMVGTPVYMSPEQVVGDPADARSDVYAMGVMIFQMLCGRTPFEGDAVELLRSHLVEPVPQLTQLRPGLEPRAELQALLERAMAKRREDRFQDAADLLRALDAIPQPWVAQNAAGDARVSNTLAVAATVIDARSSAATPTETSASGAVATAGVRRGWLGELVHGVVTVARRMLTLILLGVFVIAASVIYVMVSPRRTQERATLEHISDQVAPRLQQLAAAAPQLQRDLSAAVQAGAPAPPAAGATTTATTAPEAVPAPAAAPAPAADGRGEKDEPARLAKQVARPAARNPWLRGVPKELRTLRKAINAGEYGSEHAITLLRSYDAEHTGDTRGHLLLARLYLNRHWRADALAQYSVAHQLDASSRGAPRMLSDLLELVAQGAVADKAGHLLREAYGTEALGALDGAIRAAHGDAQALARLRALRARIVAD